jgi:hypothetical protein
MTNLCRPRVYGSLMVMIFAAIVVGAAVSSGARAEGVTPPPNVISSNPILDMFTWYNLEFEHRMAPNSTMGLAGTFISFNDGDDSYKNLSAFYRYYPQNDAPAGFYFGGRAGVFGVSTSGDEDEDEGSWTLGGIGIDIGYTWMIGSTRSFAISLGIGAVRLFGDVGDEDVAMTLPSIRAINVGFAF